jgi:hypothetical protein
VTVIVRIRVPQNHSVQFRSKLLVYWYFNTWLSTKSFDWLWNHARVAQLYRKHAGYSVYMFMLDFFKYRWRPPTLKTSSWKPAGRAPTLSIDWTRNPLTASCLMPGIRKWRAFSTSSVGKSLVQGDPSFRITHGRTVLSIIHFKVSNYSTVFTILAKAVNFADHHGQVIVILPCCQANALLESFIVSGIMNASPFCDVSLLQSWTTDVKTLKIVKLKYF